MTTHSIIQIFDNYQKARLVFVQAVAELALRPQNVDILEKAGILEMLKPLVNDVWIQVRQCATVALGRFIQHNLKTAERVVKENFMPILLDDINKQNKNVKRAVLFVMRSICKHSDELANYLVRSGSLQVLVVCLEDFEPLVKEAAAWVVGYTARHNSQLAQACVDAGIVSLLVLCLQEPELSLKQITTSALADIAKHSPELAQAVVDAGALAHLSRNLNNIDEKLKRQTLYALSCCATHNDDLAEMIVETEIFPSVLIQMAHPCAGVRKNAASLVKDVVKHSLELTQLVVNNGGISGLMEILNDNVPEVKVPAITALGYVAANSSQLAMAVIGGQVVQHLSEILEDPHSDEVTLSVTAWTLAQIGRHSPEHSNAVAACNVFRRLLELFMKQDSGEDLKVKAKTALKLCLQKCILNSALEPMLYSAPPSILKYVLCQYSKILPQDPKSRRVFVSSGGLKKVQEIEAKPGSALYEYKIQINACFPEEIVRYYSPGYPDTLLDKVEQYSPQMVNVLREAKKQTLDSKINTMEDNSDTSEDVKSLVSI